MYIKKIVIKGYRNFVDTEVEFIEGVNIIIGHNNAGKTNLLKALSLVLDTDSTKKLEVDDFYKTSNLSALQTKPPKVSIELHISQSKGEDLMSDDLVTVAPWLTKLDQPYEAQLTYHFFLPEEEHDGYKDKLSSITSLKDVWLTIKHEFLKKYVYKIYGGKPDLQSTADHDALLKFDFQFLNAIRDVERDMFTGRTTLLREVIDFFMDYEIKIDTLKNTATKTSEIKAHKLAFSVDAQKLILQLQTRMARGRDHIMKYAADTGAAFKDAEPQFDGQLSEVEMYSALRLIISYSTGIEIPATHNGLGYNNLIYMSLLLAKMQVDTNGDYLGSNAKVFPVLVIEEPEAHLHPSLQYKFLKYLQNSKYQTARQVFISSHSPNITAAVELNQIICFHHDTTGATRVGYPGKVFPDDEAGNHAKAYVQRFLDATRSDMLFANNVILVEGLAEQLLLPTFTRYLGKNLEDHHTTVISVAGRYFEYFLKMFDTNNTYTIHKKVACITDRDPTRKLVGPKEVFQKCYPFEYDNDKAAYEYKSAAESSLKKYASHPNIRFYSQHNIFGKTLEYQLMFDNPRCSLLITESIDNEAELNKLSAYYSSGKTVTEVNTDKIMRDSTENTRIIDGLQKCSTTEWDNDAQMKSLLASRYLNSIGKGGNALELSRVLEENQNSATPMTFTIPTYIIDAINWSCP